jgi:hypothetical protein
VISSTVEKRVASLPLHDDYIRAHCAAPAVITEKMA